MGHQQSLVLFLYVSILPPQECRLYPLSCSTFHATFFALIFLPTWSQLVDFHVITSPFCYRTLKRFRVHSFADFNEGKLSWMLTAGTRRLFPCLRSQIWCSSLMPTLWSACAGDVKLEEIYLKQGLSMDAHRKTIREHTAVCTGDVTTACRLNMMEGTSEGRGESDNQCVR